MKLKLSQSIIEYTILIAIAVAAVGAMRTYVLRGMQAHLSSIQEQLNHGDGVPDSYVIVDGE